MLTPQRLKNQVYTAPGYDLIDDLCIHKSSIRSYPGAVINIDHDLVLCNMRLKLRSQNMKKSNRIRFDLEKLNNTHTPANNLSTLLDAFENLWALFRRFWTLLRIYGRFFDAFGCFDSESIYSSLFRRFWALQFSIILNSSQIRRFWALQFRIDIEFVANSTLLGATASKVQ